MQPWAGSVYKMRTVDCILQTMGKMQIEDCRPGVKCRLGSLDEIYEHFWILSKLLNLKGT